MESKAGAGVLKVFALCMALGLGGTYVWQKQKTAAAHDAASKLPEKQPRTVLPGSKSAWGGPTGGKMLDQDGKVVEPPEVSEADLREALERGGDDFGMGEFVLPDEGGDEPAQEKTVLPGSKSIAPLLESPERKPADPEPQVKLPKTEP